MEKKFKNMRKRKKEKNYKNNKKILKELERVYKTKCKITFYGLLFAYFCDFAVKVYLIWKVGGTQIAFVGAIIDLLAKSFHLKNTKFRKSIFFRR